MTSPSNYEQVILALELQSNKIMYIDSVSILLRILDNIIREPHNDKYRSIRLENKIIKEKLLLLTGVRLLLEKIGFVEVFILITNGTLITISYNINLVCIIHEYSQMVL